MRFGAAKVYSIGTDVCGLLGFAMVSRSFARQLRNLSSNPYWMEIIYEPDRNRGD